MEVADALNYLHTGKEPISHRDIKPENIMLTKHMKAKLVDFGLAKETKGNQTYLGGANQGTCAYMAPELFNGVGGNFRVDLYAWGISFWEVFMRAEPYGAMSGELIPAFVLVILQPLPDDPDKPGRCTLTPPRATSARGMCLMPRSSTAWWLSLTESSSSFGTLTPISIPGALEGPH